MHCCCLYIAILCQVAGFHVQLRCLHCYTGLGYWVSCTAAVCILLYRARLLSSMHCCCMYIVIPFQFAGFHAPLLCVYCYTVPSCWVPCTADRRTLLYQVAGFCAMLLHAIVIFRLLLSCSVWYLPCVVLPNVVADTGLAGLYPLHPVLACRVHGGLYFCVLCSAMSPDAGVP